MLGFSKEGLEWNGKSQDFLESILFSNYCVATASISALRFTKYNEAKALA